MPLNVVICLQEGCEEGGAQAFRLLLGSGSALRGVLGLLSVFPLIKSSSSMLPTLFFLHLPLLPSFSSSLKPS